MRRSVDPEAFAALLGSDGEGSAVVSPFRVHSGKSSALIKVPTILAHRIYHLGCAYGSRTLASLRPGVRLVIGTVNIHAFARDLREILVLVNDPALHQSVNAVLLALDSPPGITGKSVAVAIGELDGGRA